MNLEVEPPISIFFARRIIGVVFLELKKFANIFKFLNYPERYRHMIVYNIEKFTLKKYKMIYD